MTVRVSVVPFAMTCTVAELPLPLTAAVGIKMTLLARTLTSMRAKPVEPSLTPEGSLSTEMVAAALPSELVVTAVTVPAVPPRWPPGKPPWPPGNPPWPPCGNGAPLPCGWGTPLPAG